MTTHTEKTRERILAAPAPRDIEWRDFETMWRDLADRVEQESGDRLAVDFHGHRVVFRREHDGRVGIEDIERARKLLRSGPASTEGEGKLLVLTVTNEDARFYDFDLDAHDVEIDAHDHEHETNPDRRGRRMRTNERKEGGDDKADLIRFFDELVDTLKQHHHAQRFVLLGHGTGTSNAAQQFAAYLESHHGDLSGDVVAVGTIDLSAATEAEIERAATQLAGR